jgi:hypothetical protein
VIKHRLLWLLLCTPALMACPQPNFSIGSSPGSLSVAKGASRTSQISIAPENGFKASVALSASGLPSGVTASFSPTSIAPGATSTLTLSASGSAEVVTDKKIVISGDGGGLSRTASIIVVVTDGGTTPPPPGAPTITKFTATPSSLTAAGNVTLEWDVSGATTLEIDQGVGAVTPITTGSKSVTVSATKSFTLTAKAGSATTTKSVDVTVGSVSLVPGVWDSTNWNEATWQ